jgi:hypothetical protein
MTEAKQVGEAILGAALVNLPRVLADDPMLPGIDTKDQAVDAIIAAATKDPFWASRRVWAAVLAVAAASLAVPEAQAMLGPWGPIALTAVSTLSGLLAARSYLADPRPT